MAKVGFVGLGNIGKGICGNLIKSGNELCVFDVNRNARDFFEGKAILANDVKEVCEKSDYIFLSLPNTEIVEKTVTLFMESGVNGKTIIDTSTSDPMSTRMLFEKVKKAGGDMVDAPLMTGPKEAGEGTLEIVVGGNRNTFEELQFLFQAYCSEIKYVGKIGNGHLAKLAVNFCGLSEAIIFAQIFPVMEKYGIEPKDLYEILNCEALNNWMFRFYGDKYVNKDYRFDFALSLGLKDLTYIKKLFEEMNLPGFMLDGALDICRVSLMNQKKGEPLDFSYVCQTMYDLARL